MPFAETGFFKRKRNCIPVLDDGGEFIHLCLLRRRSMLPVRAWLVRTDAEHDIRIDSCRVKDRDHHRYFSKTVLYCYRNGLAGFSG